jgi:hypothetical protein
MSGMIPKPDPTVRAPGGATATPSRVCGPSLKNKVHWGMLVLLLLGWGSSGFLADGPAYAGITGFGPAQLAAQSPPPGAAYRTFDTQHFRVVYGEGLEEVARRAAGHAEEGYRTLEGSLFSPPSGRIELLVVDHTDLSNGFAHTAPAPRIVLWARPPMDGGALSHFDDWIRLVTLHELAHLLHLDHTGPLGRAGRRVFGRAPFSWPFFTGHLLPTWAVEGVAVHLESKETRAGRAHGSAHSSMVRAQALDGGVESLGQAMGHSPVWPGGTRPYVFGSLFFHWLAERHGAEAMRDLLDSAAQQWIPFRLNAAARSATGHSLEELWDEWVAEVEAEAREAAGRLQREGAPEPQRLTQGARVAAHPAPGPAGVAYLRSDGRTDTRLVLRGEDGEERTLDRWAGTETPLSWASDGSLLGTRVEATDRWSLYRDLYRVNPSGEVARLTLGARISHADVHPETGRIVAVQEGGGTNRLVLLDGSGRIEATLVEGEPRVHWAFPRWAPEGDRIAVARRGSDGASGIWVLEVPDGEGGSSGAPEPHLVHQDRGLNTTPAWAPDGGWLLWAGDRDGASNLLARRIEGGVAGGPLHQVTWSPTGAAQPAVDRAGEWIYYTVQGADGWDLARLPYDPESWGEPAPADPRFLAGGENGGGLAPAGPDLEIVRSDRPWSPVSSLRPRFWLPTVRWSESVEEVEVLPWSVGGWSFGQDLLGRHAWFVEATSAPEDPTSRVEVAARWAWAGLDQPVVTLVGEQRYEALGALGVPEDQAEGPDDRVYPVARERRVGADLQFVRARVRSWTGLTLGLREIREERSLREADGEPSGRLRLAEPNRNLSEFLVLGSVSTVRSHAFSISPEDGVGLSAQLRERVHRGVADSLQGVPGRDGSYREGIVLFRGYRGVELPGPLPSFSRSTVAVRAAGGVARGPGAGPGHFRLGGGGGGGGGAAGFTFYDTNPTFSLRGMPRGAITGDRIWAASAELRMPLANLHRGWGARPVHLDRLATSLFVDAGGASRALGDGSRVAVEGVSAGLELALRHTLFFAGPQQLRAGVALPVVAAGPDHRGVGVYLQAGWSF